MNKLYLQNIVESVQWNDLPADWTDFNLFRFSKEKMLFDYQQKALKNALIALYKYYVELKGNKKQFLDLYKNNGLDINQNNLDINLKNNHKIQTIYKEFDKDYTIVENEIISFEHFINRMSFWMATGSGKTLIIVKLIELLANLVQNKHIPNKNILFLTYREDLIEQFKLHIEEYNASNPSITINLINLKEYEARKKNSALTFYKSIDVFYYRSDLISDEQKDKIIDFKNYDDNGNWYIILDEAHKGDKEESKRQHYYSILSRNGFLFNFSATFTDKIDFVTCVYNFNLEQFIKNGYGKQIYISQSDISELANKQDYNEKEKQIIIVKLLLLYTYINQQKLNIDRMFYHKPLLLTLVNSVNTEDSDLYLFFKELESIATGNGNIDALLQAKEALKKDLTHNCEFTEEKINIDNKKIDDLNFEDILKNVFHSTTYGKIEVLKIPGNKQEILFKLTTSDKPFGLIKIGDISEWIKNKLSNYEIIERFENESLFKTINQDDSDINILMGSRSFYEGWDSNRPNILLYINIGKGADAKKFVLQSIGRGIRIEPLPNKRKRIHFLFNNNEISIEKFKEIKDIVKPLETLFVYGTKAENLKEVMETLQQEKQEEPLGYLFEINSEIKDKLLLIPVYKKSPKILVEEKNIIKFPIHPEDYKLIKNYFNYLSEKICIVKYDCSAKILENTKKGFNGKENDYFQLKEEEPEIKNPDFLLKRIFQHYNNKTEEFDSFKKLEKEIIHFERISISKDKLNSLREKIENVKKLKDKNKIKRELQEKLKKNEINLDVYTQEIENIYEIKEEEKIYSPNEKLKIKYLANHYYFPVILAQSQQINFIKHIIKHKSEIDFLNSLENYLIEKDNFFKQFDWWYFSKIDEILDNIYIPYYNPTTNRIDKFKPDFIFWLKKDNNYIILFIDPKGTEYSDAYRKIDGYSRIFEIEENGNKKAKILNYNEYNIKVLLLLRTNNIANVPKNYINYWFSNINEIKNKL